MNELLREENNEMVLLCYNLESGFTYYQLYDWTMGKQCFESAYKASNLNIDLAGVIGKRTRYQQMDVAQLILRIQKSNEKINNHEFIYSNDGISVEQLPKVRGFE